MNSHMPPGLYLMVLVVYLVAGFKGIEAQTGEDWIKPYSENPHYWQYNGEPILLLGGTKDDNLFQIPDLEEHLTLLHKVGGNFIRNTMSSRDTTDVYPFRMLDNGTYDLDNWNPEYWTRFESLLKWCHQRDIIIQIEVWDRFDFSQDFWKTSCWNPSNNLTYTEKATGMVAAYPEHPWQDLQPFFHTIPGMPHYTPALDKVRKYQEAFVDKMLSYSLRYGNVLYCMDNETSTPPEWGKYWIAFILEAAADHGQRVYLTDMVDSFYKPKSCDVCQQVIKQPEVYTFMDISQINSRNFNQNHWDTLQYILEKVKDYPRPVNHTKVYGGGNSSWGSGSPEDGVERFCRNIIGGSASARFHRPWAGSGLSSISQAAIRSFRIAEEKIKLWDIHPHQELLTERKDDEAYVSASNDLSQYIVYFTDGGTVRLLLNTSIENYTLEWINIRTGEKENKSYIIGSKNTLITTPGNGGWMALIYQEN